MKTVVLPEPVAFGDNLYTEITIRKPIVADIRKIEVATKELTVQVDQGIMLLSILSDVPRAVFDKMDFDVFGELLEIASGFMNPSPRTGKKPSRT